MIYILSHKPYGSILLVKGNYIFCIIGLSICQLFCRQSELGCLPFTAPAMILHLSTGYIGYNFSHQCNKVVTCLFKFMNMRPSCTDGAICKQKSVKQVIESVFMVGGCRYRVCECLLALCLETCIILSYLCSYTEL